MIIKEFYRTREDGVKLYRTVSSKGLQIRKVDTDEVYDEAIDVEGAVFEYVEADTATDGSINDEISDSEALAIILGGDV